MRGKVFILVLKKIQLEARGGLKKEKKGENEKD
jgi:hypothetical protein